MRAATLQRVWALPLNGISGVLGFRRSLGRGAFDVAVEAHLYLPGAWWFVSGLGYATFSEAPNFGSTQSFG